MRRFPSGRHLASYLGLTPREFSSGLKRYLGRISKRGDGYLRTLLIHGARSLLCHAKKAEQHDPLRSWAPSLEKRTNHNKAAVAVANKLARIVWAVWSRQQPYGLQTAAWPHADGNGALKKTKGKARHATGTPGGECT